MPLSIACRTLQAPLARAADLAGLRRAPRGRVGGRTAQRVLLNTLPKSGSVFLFRMLSEGLGLPPMHIGNMYGLVDQISLEKMRVFAAGSFVSQNHLAPSLENLQILEYFGCRLILHIRDPRQALLSWVHHVDRVCRDDNGEASLMFAPRTPVGYFSWDLAQKLDWQIDNYLPLSIEWLDCWLMVHDDSRVPVLLTTYEELSADIGGLCRRICDFCGIAPAMFRLVDLPKTIDNHFRLGDRNEWRRVFSAAQIERSSAMLPPAMAHRFDWFYPGTEYERPRRHPAPSI
jgi:hypothetical protein